MKTSSHQTVLDYLRSLAQRHGDGSDSDRELLRRFTERRDADAFTALLWRHGPMVLNVARRITGDGQLAEDVFQAVFLLLSRKAQGTRRAAALPCWLHRIAHRIAVQARHSHIRRREQEMRMRPSAPPTPLEELTAQELLAVLDEELYKLPENYRAPLILCYLEGLSQEEAAKRLGCSAGSIKGRLERGRKQLRLRLAQRGLALPGVLGGTLLVADAGKAMSPSLVQATLAAVKSGASATPTIAALIHQAMRSAIVNKLKAIGAAVVLLAIAGSGVSMMTLGPPAAREGNPASETTAPLASTEKGKDMYGVPPGTRPIPTAPRSLPAPPDPARPIYLGYSKAGRFAGR